MLIDVEQIELMKNVKTGHDVMVKRALSCSYDEAYAVAKVWKANDDRNKSLKSK